MVTFGISTSPSPPPQTYSYLWLEDRPWLEYVPLHGVFMRSCRGEKSSPLPCLVDAKSYCYAACPHIQFRGKYSRFDPHTESSAGYTDVPAEVVLRCQDPEVVHPFEGTATMLSKDERE